MHDLHIWAISTNIPALSAHIVIADTDAANSHQVLEDVHSTLEKQFRLLHTTIQIEMESYWKSCSGELHGA